MIDTKLRCGYVQLGCKKAHGLIFFCTYFSVTMFGCWCKEDEFAVV
jgi:hypothetical protein